MDTVTTAADGVRPADKVLQALATLAALLDRTINEVKSLDGDLQSRLMQAVHDTEASLQEQLNTKFQNQLQSALDGLKLEFETERERFNKELLHAVEAASQLESERSALIAEVEKAKDEAKTAAAKVPASAPAASALAAVLHEEIKRAEEKLQDILRIIDDPVTELSTVIRKNVEKSEVEAYLKGIRFALNGEV